MGFYQQGDVKLHPCTLAEMTSQRTMYRNGQRFQAGTMAETCDHLSVAEGEATGHAHRSDLECATTEAWATAEVRELFGQRFLIVTGGRVTLTHEEHAAQLIGPGMYRVDIVKEYDPLARITRIVAD